MIRRKRKLNITTSVIFYDGEGKKHHTATTHHHDLSTPLQDLVATVPQDKRPGGPDETYTILLPVPARPITYVPPNAQPIVPGRLKPKKEEKGLGPAHSSLPVKPAWVPEISGDEPVVSSETVDEQEEHEEQSILDQFSAARQVWQVTLQNEAMPQPCKKRSEGQVLWNGLSLSFGHHLWYSDSLQRGNWNSWLGEMRR